MPTRNVVLTDRHEKLIDALVGSGRYQNASEVLRAGLRLVEERETSEAAKLELLREAICLGEADIASGRFRAFRSNAELTDYLIAGTDDVIGGAAN